MHILNALMSLAMAILILAQRSEDGYALMLDYHGLAGAFLILLFNTAINLVAALPERRAP